MKRIVFAQYRCNEFENDSEFLRAVSSDKCRFSLSRKVNKQNGWIWVSKRPKKVYRTPQIFFSVMVWCTLSQKEIIGPYLFENKTVTGQSYKGEFGTMCLYDFETIWNTSHFNRMVLLLNT